MSISQFSVLENSDATWVFICPVGVELCEGSVYVYNLTYAFFAYDKKGKRSRLFNLGNCMLFTHDWNLIKKCQYIFSKRIWTSPTIINFHIFKVIFGIKNCVKYFQRRSLTIILSWISCSILTFIQSSAQHFCHLLLAMKHLIYFPLKPADIFSINSSA